MDTGNQILFMQLTNSITQIPKIQKPLVAALKKLEIHTISDLLWHLPYRYLDFSQTKTINELEVGQNTSIQVKIKNISSRFSFRGRMSLAEALVSDGTGSIKVVWFNQPYLAKSLKAGDEIFLAGQADYYNNSLQLTNPIYEKVSDFPVHTTRLVPLYHLKKDIYPKTFRNLVALVLDCANYLKETLPKGVLESQNLLSLSETVRQSHFPKNLETFEQAKKRLAFEEIFLNQLLAQKHKLLLSQKQSFLVKFNQELVKTFLNRLPFTLTLEQKKASWQILKDLEKPAPMNRLLEGDVGSGKTLVALIATIEAISQGLQVVLLAPTEILAKQHAQTAEKFLLTPIPLNFNTRCILLTQNYCQINGKEQKRKNVLNELSLGMPGLYVGTHALLEKKVKFKNLALVIIDEQHRFGVNQRAELIKSKNRVPHLLSLSATPIPRSLQLAFFGELDISQIKTKPAERKTIVTKLVNHESRPKAYEFVKNEIKKGRQIFVITPLVEENIRLEVKSAKKELENILKIFPEFKVGLLYGKMKGKEKEQVMADFLANKTQILVATSVVEVGVDVPNASVMLIEGAERFGLAQLHQFRGRVGRSEHQSYCFLFVSSSGLAKPKPGDPELDSLLRENDNITKPLSVSPLDKGERINSPSQLSISAKFHTPHPFSKDTESKIPSLFQKGGQGGVKSILLPTSQATEDKYETGISVAPSPFLGRAREGHSEEISKAVNRLESFTKTQDGFALAELDLKQRGFGELYGSSQSGINFKYFDESYTSLIQPAREEALKILKNDIGLKNYPLLQEKIKDKIMHFE